MDKLLFFEQKHGLKTGDYCVHKVTKSRFTFRTQLRDLHLTQFYGHFLISADFHQMLTDVVLTETIILSQMKIA